MNRDALEIKPVAAALAVPGKAVELVRAAAPLDHDADGAGGTLRGMRNLGRQQEHLACADRHFDHPPGLNRLQHDVSLELKKQFRAGIVVEILA